MKSNDWCREEAKLTQSICPTILNTLRQHPSSDEYYQYNAGWHQTIRFKSILTDWCTSPYNKRLALVKPGMDLAHTVSCQKQSACKSEHCVTGLDVWNIFITCSYILIIYWYFIGSSVVWERCLRVIISCIL
jgi:hypothetical protein